MTVNPFCWYYMYVASVNLTLTRTTYLLLIELKSVLFGVFQQRIRKKGIFHHKENYISLLLIELKSVLFGVFQQRILKKGIFHH